MNFLMDRSVENWAKQLATAKAKAGDCDTSALIVPIGNLTGRYNWTCKTGQLSGKLLLAPIKNAQIQALNFTVTS